MVPEKDYICCIYVLFNPIEPLEIKYVGKTTFSVERRLKFHISDARKKRTYKQKWISSLLEKDVRPEIKIIEKINTSDICVHNEREKYWIAEYRKNNTKITNLTDGGDGGAMPPEIIERIKAKKKGWKASEKTKRLLSQVFKKRWQSKEYREKMKLRKPAHCKPHTEAAKQKMSINRKAIVNDEFRERLKKNALDLWSNPEYREKAVKAIRAAIEKPEVKENKRIAGLRRRGQIRSNKGKPLSLETRQKISNSLKGKASWNAGKKMSAECRKKQSQNRKGKSLSTEHRKNVIESIKRRWQDPEFRKKMSDIQKKRWADTKKLNTQKEEPSQ